MRSKFEARIAKQLTESKVAFEYEPDTIEYFMPVGNTFCKKCKSFDTVKIRSYLPDFVVNEVVILETKGKLTAEERTKIKALFNCFRDDKRYKFDFRMVFQADNWLTKKHKTRYSDWCKRNNIPYAIGKVPEEWIKEFKEYDS